MSAEEGRHTSSRGGGRTELGRSDSDDAEDGTGRRPVRCSVYHGLGKGRISEPEMDSKSRASLFRQRVRASAVFSSASFSGAVAKQIEYHSLP